MPDVFLTLNAGSSSIKFALFAARSSLPEVPEIVGEVDRIGSEDGAVALRVRDGLGSEIANATMSLASDPKLQYAQALNKLADWIASQAGEWNIVRVGHRVVHGGAELSAPVQIDEDQLVALRRLISLAPLHQPHNLNGIEIMRRRLPHVPHIACFDTAFHRAQDALAQQFALPPKVTRLGVQRYGFHGLSYEYIASVLPQHLGARAEGRVIVAHLGNGASLCAMRGRRSVATTMGFSTLDGLMMGTRCGSLDPGVLIYLLEDCGYDLKTLQHLLYHESGLLGVSGMSGDMRTLLAAKQPDADAAIDLFCYRVVREIGSHAAALDGLDALVFTGGIGEHAAPVRERICARLKWLGIQIDAQKNAAGATQISSADASVATYVIPTNEEWVIARHVAALPI